MKQEAKRKTETREHSSHWLGGAVRTAGALGAGFCLLLMLAAPFAAVRYRSAVQRGFGNAAGLLLASGQSLEDAGDAAAGLADVMGTIVVTLQGASGSLVEVQNLSGTAYDLLHDQIPETLENTSDALVAVEAASGEIDSMLRAMDAISFLTGVQYDPDQPLDEAVAGVVESLDPISQSLEDVSQSLQDSNDDLETTAESLALLAEQLQPYEQQLTDLSDGLQKLGPRMTEAGEGFARQLENLPLWTWVTLVVVELVLLWSLLGQVAVYNVGKLVMVDTREAEAVAGDEVAEP